MLQKEKFNIIIGLGVKMKKTIILILIPIIIILCSTIGLLILKNTTYRLIRQKNGEFEYYKDRTIYGIELATLINKAVNENELNRVSKDEKQQYIENGENSIKIDIKITETNKTYPMESFYNSDTTRFVENFGLIKFKCVRT